jgi:hypothetical protein
LIFIFTGGCLRKAGRMETIKVVWEKWVNSLKTSSTNGEYLKLVLALILAIPVMIVVYPISLFFPKGTENG